MHIGYEIWFIKIKIKFRYIEFCKYLTWIVFCDERAVFNKRLLYNCNYASNFRSNISINFYPYLSKSGIMEFKFWTCKESVRNSLNIMDVSTAQWNVKRSLTSCCKEFVLKSFLHICKPYRNQTPHYFRKHTLCGFNGKEIEREKERERDLLTSLTCCNKINKKHIKLNTPDTHTHTWMPDKI